MKRRKKKTEESVTVSGQLNAAENAEETVSEKAEESVSDEAEGSASQITEDGKEESVEADSDGAQESAVCDDAFIDDLLVSDFLDDPAEKKSVSKFSNLFISFEVLLLFVIVTFVAVFGYILSELKVQNALSESYISELSSIRESLRLDAEAYEQRRIEQMEENKKIAMFLEDEEPEEDNGFYITLGTYEQDGNTENGAEPVEWQVLSQDDKGILLISRYILDCVPYNDTQDEVTWENCSLRKWLNDDFLNTAFSDEERLKINTVSVENEDNTRWETYGGNLTGDKIFCLSTSELTAMYEIDAWFTAEEPDELGRYEIGYSDLLIAKPTAYALDRGAFTNAFDEESYDEFYEAIGYEKKYIGRMGSAWWLRTPGFDGSFACRVGYDGLFGDGDSLLVTSDMVGVRPAMYISRN